LAAPPPLAEARKLPRSGRSPLVKALDKGGPHGGRLV
jgi:hypothetical protein